MNRTANYSAFYVAEPFNEGNLGAHQAKDFCYYNMLRAWKGRDSTFPFVDAHDKTYNVRDGSDFEKTLKPRLHQRLSASANIILFLSSNIKNSIALKEEIDYGINTLELPVIVVYPELDLSEISDGVHLTSKVKKLWDRLPKFRDCRYKVPVVHVPMQQKYITYALNNSKFRVATKTDAGIDYFYTE